MNRRIDAERILDAFLAPEPDRLPDRVIDAALDDIARTPQRHALRVSWRFTSVPNSLRTAAIAIVTVVGVGILAFTLRSPGVGTNTPAPPTASPVRESARPLAGGLLAGATIDSGPFGEPFTFIMPIPASNGPNEGLPRQFSAARPDLATGLIAFSGPWWSLRFVDDMPVPVDICDAESEMLPDIPATTAAVGDWLEAEQPKRASSWVVAQPVELPVDGRTALRWDLVESVEDAGCSVAVPANASLWGEMLIRVYAIPTSDDTILLIGGSDMVNFTAVSTVMDEIVRSMDFR
jgi:hypothetical protein